MTEATNLRDTIAPKSNQMNADDLIAGPRTITITKVSRGNAEQPVAINFQGDDGKPYYPCKSMRRVMIHAWGDNGNDWVGQSLTLYCDGEVKFGGVKVGGIRISHMTGIHRTMDIALTATRGKRTPYQVKPLEVSKEPPAPTFYPDEKFQSELPRMLAALSAGRTTVEAIVAHCEKTAPLTQAQRLALQPAPQQTEEQF